MPRILGVLLALALVVGVVHVSAWTQYGRSTIAGNLHPSSEADFESYQLQFAEFLETHGFRPVPPPDARSGWANQDFILAFAGRYSDSPEFFVLLKGSDEPYYLQATVSWHVEGLAWNRSRNEARFEEFTTLIDHWFKNLPDSR